VAVYAEWITSHAISYFFLTQPDVLGAGKGIFGLMQQYPHIAEVAFSIKNTFDVSVFEDHVSEMRADWSFARFPYLSRLGFPDGIFHFGPLSRAFLNHSAINMPGLQNYEIIDRAMASKGIHLEYIDVMQLAEIVWAATKIKELLQEIDLSGITTDPMTQDASGKGIGVVEATKGV